MDTLRDALKGALGPADPLQARELPPTQAALGTPASRSTRTAVPHRSGT